MLQRFLRSRVRRSEKIKSITLIHENKDIILNRDNILSDNFKIRPTDLK